MRDGFSAARGVVYSFAMSIEVRQVCAPGDPRVLPAVRRVLLGRAAATAGAHDLPRASELRAGAEAAHAARDDDAARRFQAILELGYLVASADGFAEAEKSALAALLEQVTGAAVGHDELELHFRDLEEACRMLGRRERLRRAAADVEDALHQREALGFAVAVAVADGVLDPVERDQLAELAGFFGLAEDEVQRLVGAVLGDIERALAAEAPA
jgi:tellurite resistance protein